MSQLLPARPSPRRQKPSALLLLCWVVAGSVALANTSSAAPPDEEVAETELSPVDRDHWAFQPLRQTATSPPTQPRARNTIDSWIAHQWHSRNLQPALPAAPHTYFRRLSYDLRGLPPTPHELETWSALDAPDAAPRVVDQLLASPAYGEYVAQRWLDLARFAETDGFEHDGLRPHAGLAVSRLGH